jgi:hypothetical protein
MIDSINIIEVKGDSKGGFFCDIPITKEQWLELIRDKGVTTLERMKVLLSLYFMPEHKASCIQLAEKYGSHYNVYNAGVTSYGKAVTKKLGSFTVMENGQQRFWHIPIGKGCEIKIDGISQFVWQMRQELVEAIETVLIEDAIEEYASDFENHWKDEQYKWQAVQWFQDNWNIDAANFTDMIENATSKTFNLLASMNSFPRGMIIGLAKVAPNEVKDMFIHLYDESIDLSKRVQGFIDESDKLRIKHNPGNWNMHYQNTNAISTYLWLHYPEKYYIYKYNEYRDVVRKLGLNYSFKRGQVSEMVKGFQMYNQLNDYLHKNPNVVEIIKSHTSISNEIFNDTQLRTTTIDFGFWVSRWFKSKEESLYNNTSVNMDPFISSATELLKNKKNIILQGAPGTGKTYNTSAIAVALIDGNIPSEHEDVMARYEQLRKENRIGFTAFHQSMDYEDFIEGIKPKFENGVITYKVEEGIFKRICIAAHVASEVVASGTDNLLEGMNDNPTIWKVSLEATGDNATRRDCMKNGHIRIGWGNYGDIDFTEDHPEVTEGKSILRAFQNDMKIGDIVVSCWSQDETDAIGIITGDYEYRTEGGNLPRYRDVKWIVKNIKHNIKNINNGKHMTLGTVYRLSITLKDILDVIEMYAPKHSSVVSNAEKPFVLIIDEINRGNVSKIFGELITLLEKDKRLGAEHPVKLSLPYSQPDFGVPQNLYIIGTMNTTDRSTGTIDYAIRRRFAFLTLPANRDVIKNEKGKVVFDNVESFIKRFKYADMNLEDLMVGHSYFMADVNEELALKIRYEVIPLIKEYIKDGILSVRPNEASKYFEAWQKLETWNDNDSGTSED